MAWEFRHGVWEVIWSRVTLGEDGLSVSIRKCGVGALAGNRGGPVVLGHGQGGVGARPVKGTSDPWGARVLSWGWGGEYTCVLVPV
jgi:hypothetical protein